MTSDNRILSIISENNSLRRKFHNLDKEKRRKVLQDINHDQVDEKSISKSIRRIKRVKQNGDNNNDKNPEISQRLFIWNRTKRRTVALGEENQIRD